MKNSRAVRLLFILVSLSAGMANAAQIATFTDFLTATDPTQTGRLSRNNIAQDWSGGEAFPGVINTTSLYHYQTYSFNVGDTPYIQIEVDSLSPATFVSAYDLSYSPDSAGGPNFGFDTNWLGDAGGSGNFFGTDPLFFQVVVPAFHNLIIVVNQTSVGTTAATGIGNTNPFTINVEGFIDSQFTDPPGVPEPSTVLMGGSGLAIFWLVRRFSVGLAASRLQ
jgi:hypothetical protein